MLCDTHICLLKSFGEHATEGEGRKLFFNIGCEAWAKGELALETHRTDATAKGQLSGSGLGAHEGRKCSKEIVDCFNGVIGLFMGHQGWCNELCGSGHISICV